MSTSFVAYDDQWAFLSSLRRMSRQEVAAIVTEAEKQGELLERMASIPAGEPRVIVATGRYLGEGFDDERLDTLFLALPIAWRGTLTHDWACARPPFGHDARTPSHAGRLHRLNDAKKEVIIYDYVDVEVPVLARMHAKRRTGYKAIGYEIVLPDNGQARQLSLEDL